MRMSQRNACGLWTETICAKPYTGKHEQEENFHSEKFSPVFLCAEKEPPVRIHTEQRYGCLKYFSRIKINMV